MRRGTTPTHTFNLPEDFTTLEELKIVYAQSGKEILTKYKQDCAPRGTSVSVTLTQEETLKFSACSPCQIQLRALTATGQALASEIMEIKVLPILDNGVLVCN